MEVVVLLYRCRGTAEAPLEPTEVRVEVQVLVTLGVTQVGLLYNLHLQVVVLVMQEVTRMGVRVHIQEPEVVVLEQLDKALQVLRELTDVSSLHRSAFSKGRLPPALLRAPSRGSH